MTASPGRFDSLARRLFSGPNTQPVGTAVASSCLIKPLYLFRTTVQTRRHSTANNGFYDLKYLASNFTSQRL